MLVFVYVVLCKIAGEKMSFATTQSRGNLPTTSSTLRNSGKTSLLARCGSFAMGNATEATQIALLAIGGALAMAFTDEYSRVARD